MKYCIDYTVTTTHSLKTVSLNKTKEFEADKDDQVIKQYQKFKKKVSDWLCMRGKGNRRYIFKEYM